MDDGIAVRLSIRQVIARHTNERKVRNDRAVEEVRDGPLLLSPYLANEEKQCLAKLAK